MKGGDVDWWLEVEQRKTIHIEAAGRALSDLRFWLDGRWLVDAEPTHDIVDPAVGRPLRVLRMVKQLEPGLYRVSAYGGLPQAWADGAEEYPFHLRMGFPRLPGNGSPASPRFVPLIKSLAPSASINATP